MKTTVLIVAILINILFSNVVFGQEKNELKLSYGYSGIDAYYSGILEFGEGPHDQTRGTLAIGYNRKINNRVSVGAQINYTQTNNKFKTKEKGYVYEGVEYPNHNVYKEDSKLEHIVCPFAKVDFRYINKPGFEMYSSAMLGLISIEEMFPFHITGLGFRHGQQHAVFYELGYGFGHIISIGYSVKI